MNKRTLITAAAAIFAASTFVASVNAANLHCGGTNACKGQGLTEVSNSLECRAKNGKVL